MLHGCAASGRAHHLNRHFLCFWPARCLMWGVGPTAFWGQSNTLPHINGALTHRARKRASRIMPLTATKRSA